MARVTSGQDGARATSFSKIVGRISSFRGVGGLLMTLLCGIGNGGVQTIWLLGSRHEE